MRLNALIMKKDTSNFTGFMPSGVLPQVLDAILSLTPAKRSTCRQIGSHGILFLIDLV